MLSGVEETRRCRLLHCREEFGIVAVSKGRSEGVRVEGVRGVERCGEQGDAWSVPWAHLAGEAGALRLRVNAVSSPVC